MKTVIDTAPPLFARLPDGPFDVVLADPPWAYWGAADKWAAAGQHYSCVPTRRLADLPVAALLARRSVVFMWTTSAKLHEAVWLLRRCGLVYRGVAFVWVKTRRDGRPLGAAGVRPSIIKPLTEFVLVGSTVARGRPLPLASEAIQQTVFAPVGRHSAKPVDVQDRIDQLYPGARRLELFARTTRDNWTAWGNEVPS